MSLGLLAAGCGGADKAKTIGPSPLPSPSPGMMGTEDTPPGPRPSQLADDLKAAGLDIANLPKLDSLTSAQLKAVMKTFATSLGATCKDCHSTGKFSDWTPNKHVAQKMWDVFLRQLKLSGGGAFYCDSCHQGKAEFLDRSQDKIKDWMKRNFVGKLARVDGKPHNCATCHGTPMNDNFLDDWEKGDEMMSGDDGGDTTPVDLSSTTVRDMGVTPPPADLAVTPPAPDMTQPATPPDMSKPPTQLNCLQLNDCLVACSDSTCYQGCLNKATQQAKQKLNDAIDCGNTVCEAARRCTSDTDVSDKCVACFENSLSGGSTGYACDPTNDPNCGDCADQWTACELD